MTPEAEKQMLAALSMMQRALIEIKDDVHWFKQRELNKVEAVNRQMRALQAGLPGTKNAG